MNKFACAALAILGTGALVLAATPLDAKGGGGGHGGASMRGMARASFRPAPRPNIGPLSQRGYPVARNIGPLSGRYLASRGYYGHGGHNHGQRRWGGPWYDYGHYGYSDYGFSDYGYSDYGYSDYGMPVMMQMPDEARPAARTAEPVIRTVENSKNVCASQDVKVPGSNGETTVTILRC